MAISAIGTNDASSTPGAKTPTSAAIGPITAAREYAGEVAARPMTSASTNPIASALSLAGPTSAAVIGAPSGGVPVVTASGAGGQAI